jgi:hypothetical protein
MIVSINDIRHVAKRVQRGVESDDLNHLNPEIREIVLDDIITLTEMIDNFGEDEIREEDG